MRRLIPLLISCAQGLCISVSVADFFDGVDEASKPVMEQARQRIEQIRKGDFVVRFVGPDGVAVTGQASLRLVRHEFQFGANLRAVSTGLREDSPARAEALRVIEDLFSAVRLGNFWRHMEPERGKAHVWDRVDRDVGWAREHGMAMRFHCLIYNHESALPAWAREVKSTDEWWELVAQHIRAVAERYGDMVAEYDVINEMILWASWERQNLPLCPPLSDPQVGARIFHLARKYLPKATLVSLEAGLATVAESNGRARAVFDYHKALLDLGAPVDAIGHQAHFFAGKWPFQQGHENAGPAAYTMKGISDGLDRLGSLGKPVHITEFTAPSRSSKRKDPQPGLTNDEVAAWAANFYTLAFSKPYVRQLICWNVVDGVGSRAMDAGLLTKQGEKKPLYHALRKLLKEEWSTRWQGNLADGRAAFRGFFGTYEVEVPSYELARFTIGSQDNREIVLRLKPQ